ncbi:MAG: radical SAM protein [Deltaproteobacteria bacterium]|nr:radical SAM protein [Deltaproteobacteria bacterium]
MDRQGQKARPPRLVAWETTRACNLACRHCRAEAQPAPAPGELDGAESMDLLARLAAFSPPPMVILSGGEPLMRPDILDLARRGTSLGLRMLLSTNGTLLSPSLAKGIKKAGIRRLSLSLDAPEAPAHDGFRGLPGSFAAIVESSAILKAEGLPFQINSTITPDNIGQTEAISTLALSLGAVAHHVFLLVPVGRARDWGGPGLPPEAYEEALARLRRREGSIGLEFKATCAPQYNRISRQLALPIPPRSGRGCLGGQGFMFVSHDGRVGACGYLPLEAGNVRQAHPVDIYENSELFRALRDRERYRGRCRDCEYWDVCGGCRARAHAQGDYLGPEPLCPHQPGKARPAAEARRPEAKAC